MNSTRVAVAFTVLGLFLAGYAIYKTVDRPHYRTAEFAGVSLRLELATTPPERERGLSGREHIDESFGMLFVFPIRARYGFWMKDTLVPLDIYWLGDQGQVVSAFTDVSPDTYPTVLYPAEDTRYVLETVAGFGKAHGVATGTVLHLQSWPTVSR